MNKKFAAVWAFIFFIFSAIGNPRPAFSETLPPLPAGPLILTSVVPDQLHADYWISRLPEPDKVLMTPDQREAFNDAIHEIIGDRVDIFKLDKVRFGKHVRDQIQLEYGAVKNRRLYGIDDQVIPASLFEETIKPLIQTGKIPERIQMRWGVAVRPASVRALPTEVKMLEKLHDIEFDQLQYTLIKLWTPVGIFHESKDGKWLYIQAPYSRGWVKKKDIAFFASQKDMRPYLKSNSFLNVTGESVPVFSDAEFSVVLARPSMGTILPLAKKTPDDFIIYMPGRDEGGNFVAKRAHVNPRTDITEGFPAYTQRNIIQQAFKLLGARYGWGGAYNGRDCSGFTHDVFLSMGLDMPRNSKEQGFVGAKISNFEPYHNSNEKTYFLHRAIPGVTLLRMPMHLMLYLGEVNGKFYVIHCTWAERISMDSDEKNRINQVVVSDLSLNGKSYLGSLYDRLISINELLYE